MGQWNRCRNPPVTGQAFNNHTADQPVPTIWVCNDRLKEGCWNGRYDDVKQIKHQTAFWQRNLDMFTLYMFFSRFKYISLFLFHHSLQVEACLIFSGRWIQWLFYWTSLDILGYAVLHLVWIFPDMSDAQARCRSWLSAHFGHLNSNPATWTWQPINSK